MLKVVEKLWESLWERCEKACGKVLVWWWKSFSVKKCGGKSDDLHRMVEKFSRRFTHILTEVIGGFSTISTGFTTATTIYIKEVYGD